MRVGVFLCNKLSILGIAMDNFTFWICSHKFFTMGDSFSPLFVRPFSGVDASLRG
jgi:hypothetical protein